MAAPRRRHQCAMPRPIVPVDLTLARDISLLAGDEPDHPHDAGRPGACLCEHGNNIHQSTLRLRDKSSTIGVRCCVPLKVIPISSRQMNETPIEDALSVASRHSIDGRIGKRGTHLNGSYGQLRSTTFNSVCGFSFFISWPK